MSTARQLADLLTNTGDVKSDALDNVASDLAGLTDATVSASDPTITINPSAIGHLWVNKTSGEQYICTDATTDNNIWTNIGDGTGNINPNDLPDISGLTVDTVALASYSWADINTGTDNDYTIAGATDTETAAASLVYSITNISDSNLTASGGIAGTDNVTLTVASISSDIDNVTFKITVTDTDTGASSSLDQTIDLKSVVFTSATGGTRVVDPSDSNYYVHTFTGDSNFVVSTAGTTGVEYLVIAGGGSGGNNYGAGAGAGGYRNSHASETSGGGATTESTLTVAVQTYAIVVGAGGAGHTTSNTSGNVGSDSSFSTITSKGGGAGAGGGTTLGGSGGSGGGSGYANTARGASTVSPNQGYDGGAGTGGSPDYTAGGGGGAGSLGVTAINNGVAGNGGDGLASLITGLSVTRAGGGGCGFSQEGGSGSIGAGGSGGGGNGGTSSTGSGSAGGTNTGSGGGGTGGDCGTSAPSSGAGGSGIVIIRYKFQ